MILIRSTQRMKTRMNLKSKYKTISQTLSWTLFWYNDVITRISTWKRIFNKVLPDERAIYFAYEGDLLRAFVAGTETVVSDIEIKCDQYMYTISQIEPIHNEL